MSTGIHRYRLRVGEAFPTKRETAQVVAKKLIEDILLRFGFPAQVGLDNGPAFVSQVSQGVARALGARWKLHCAYRPQSSGQVERMNRTLKEILTKLVAETGRDWVALLRFTGCETPPTNWNLPPSKLCMGYLPQ